MTVADRADQYDRPALLDCSQGRLFGPDGPRLPAPDMLMFDRITRISNSGGAFNRGEVVAELDVNPNLWFFGCHFPGDPVMPGCLGVDALWQLVGFFLGWSGGEGQGRALGCGAIKFTGQVLPSAKRVTYRLSIKRVIRRGLCLGIADGSVTVDDQPIYSAEGLRVGLFQPADADAAASPG